jgi:outer membrane protein assembly factor BamB
LETDRALLSEGTYASCSIQKILGEKRKMQIAKNKSMATLIALFLMFAMTFSLVALPTANAHTPIWNIPTFAFINATPNPVGLGQNAFVVMWIDKAFPSAVAGNDVRPHDYTLTIIKPDGTTQTMNWPVVTDPTSSQYTSFTADQIGNYTLKFNYGGQVYTFGGAYQSDVFLPSNATTTLTVQQQPVAATPDYPLPTAYWTRPIEGQNTNWAIIASNWLGSTDYSAMGSPSLQYDFQPNGTAPNTAHIMWTKPVNYGGIVGGSPGGITGNSFYTGSSYQERFNQPIIMYGKLYYSVPYGNNPTGGGYTCVDLTTGETLWTTNTTGIGDPQFGYNYEYDSPNQHGVLPNGLLITTATVSGLGTVWRTYDPNTGIPTTMNITNVPSGYQVYGASGETIQYVLTNYGSTTVPKYNLLEWNSSNVFGGGSGLAPANWYSGTANASLPSSYDWNITAPWLMSGATILSAFIGDILLGRNGSLPAIGADNPYTYWAMSLKPATRGQMLWMKTYDAPSGNITVLPGPVDQTTRVFALAYKETRQWVGFSLDSGNLVWGPTPSENSYSYYTMSMLPYGNTPFGRVAYGRLYDAGYGGVLYCFDMRTGSLLWTYGNGGPGNSTSAGLDAVWPNWPIFPFAIADGKIYLGQGEHSMNTPIYKGELTRCVDAYTGQEMWTIMGNAGYRTRSGMAVADGYMAYLNRYDEQIDCFGMGPSATKVEAPMTSITAGDKVVIRGTVTDISAGTQQEEQAADFPNGVPAVSDASMSAWMEYVYMQKPMPTNVTGVNVSLDAIDPNGNYIHIGNVTSDTSGTFGYTWTAPNVPGQYNIIATFAGSESYWSSHAETYSVVQGAPAATAAPTPTPLSVADMYFVPAVAAIIVVIIIVGAVIALLMLRKRP